MLREEAGIDARFQDIGAAIQETIEPMPRHFGGLGCLRQGVTLNPKP